MDWVEALVSDILAHGYEEVFTTPGRSREERLLAGRLLQTKDGQVLGRFGGQDYWHPTDSAGVPNYKDGRRVSLIRINTYIPRFFMPRELCHIKRGGGEKMKYLIRSTSSFRLDRLVQALGAKEIARRSDSYGWGPEGGYEYSRIIESTIDPQDPGDTLVEAAFGTTPGRKITVRKLSDEEAAAILAERGWRNW